MDKLELDARVARLERRVGWLSALLFGCLAMLGGVLFFALRVDRMEATPELPATAAIPAPPVPIFPAEVPEAMHPDVPARPGTVTDLSTRLAELWDLRRRGLLDVAEFETKKQQLLARPFHPAVLSEDLEQLDQLRRQNLLSDADFQTFKAKILESQY